MSVSVKRQHGSYWLFRIIFVLSVVGLILAGIGFTWVETGYSSVAHQAALYSGVWVLSNDESAPINELGINNQDVILTIHGFQDDFNLGNGFH